MTHLRAISCFLCSKKYFPTSYPFHLKSCIDKQPHRTIQCPTCKIKVGKIEFQEHYFSCQLGQGVNCAHQQRQGGRSIQNPKNGCRNLNHQCGNSPVLPSVAVSASVSSSNLKSPEVQPDDRVPKRRSSVDYSSELDISESITGSSSSDDYNTAEATKEGQNKMSPVDTRLACSICGRKFSPERVHYHENICKGPKKKRRIFNSKAQRNRDVNEESSHSSIKRELQNRLRSTKSSVNSFGEMKSNDYSSSSSGLNFMGPSCLSQNTKYHSSLLQMKSAALRNALPKYSYLGRTLDPWHFNWRKKHQEFQSLVNVNTNINIPHPSSSYYQKYRTRNSRSILTHHALPSPSPSSIPSFSQRGSQESLKVNSRRKYSDSTSCRGTNQAGSSLPSYACPISYDPKDERNINRRRASSSSSSSLSLSSPSLYLPRSKKGSKSSALRLNRQKERNNEQEKTIPLLKQNAIVLMHPDVSSVSISSCSGSSFHGERKKKKLEQLSPSLPFHTRKLSTSSGHMSYKSHGVPV